MRMVLLLPVSGLVAGAALGMRWADVPVALLVAVLVGWALLAVHAGRVGQPGLIAAAAVGAFAVGGILLASDRWHDLWRPSLRVLWETVAHEDRLDAERAGRFRPVDDSAVLVVVGTLKSDASLSPSGTVGLSLDVHWAGRARGSPSAAATNPVTGGVQLTVLGSQGASHAGEWRAGRTIRAVADLHRVARYLDPAVPDFERVQARRGITLVGSVKSAALVDLLARGSSADERAGEVRALTRRAIADAVAPWSARAAAIVAAIVIGDRSSLDQAVETRLQEAGTYHVLAISGGNIAILAALTLWLFRLAGFLGRTAMFIAAGSLLAYGQVVMGGASVDRAVLMAVVYFVGRGFDLRAPPAQALVLAAGVLVLRDPLTVADSSALLTFGATAGILVASTAVDLSHLPKPLAALGNMLLASMAAEAALLPVAATLFARVTFAGLLLNFGAIPLMAVAQLSGMLLVPVWAVWPAAARLLGGVAFVGAEGLVRTADLVALAPWVTWRVAAPSTAIVATYYGSLLAGWLAWRRRAASPQPSTRARPEVALQPKSGILARQGHLLCLGVSVCCALAIVAPAWLVADTHGDGRLHVTFIDVGQGDAALVRFPHGSTMLIDAGGIPGSGSFDVGERIVAPVLRWSGVHRLSTLVLSHGDADHIGGARAVIDEFRPWQVWDGVPVPMHRPSRDLHDLAQARGIQWNTLQRADEVEMDGVRIRVLGPPLPDWERQDVRNDDSVVLDLRYGDVSIVFTGDIGTEAESLARPLIEPAPLRIVKVPHHGSRTSSSADFLQTLSPDIAIVSVGRSNGFGHPASAVLARYAQTGAAIFRTDTDGAVFVQSDGRQVDVRSYTGRSITRATGGGSAKGAPLPWARGGKTPLAARIAAGGLGK